MLELLKRYEECEKRLDEIIDERDGLREERSALESRMNVESTVPEIEKEIKRFKKSGNVFFIIGIAVCVAVALMTGVAMGAEGNFISNALIGLYVAFIMTTPLWIIGIVKKSKGAGRAKKLKKECEELVNNKAVGADAELCQADINEIDERLEELEKDMENLLDEYSDLFEYSGKDWCLCTRRYSDCEDFEVISKDPAVLEELEKDLIEQVCYINHTADEDEYIETWLFYSISQRMMAIFGDDDSFKDADERADKILVLSGRWKLALMVPFIYLLMHVYQSEEFREGDWNERFLFSAISDLDGLLENSEGLVTEKTIEAIRAADEEEVYSFVAEMQAAWNKILVAIWKIRYEK